MAKRKLDWERIARAEINPIRVKVLEHYAQGKPTSPTKVADAIDERLGNVSYHVKMLEAMGLLKLVDTIPRRGAVEHIYALA